MEPCPNRPTHEFLPARSEETETYNQNNIKIKITQVYALLCKFCLIPKYVMVAPEKPIEKTPVEPIKQEKK